MPHAEPIKIAIPIMGKMATRSFHMPHFRTALRCHGMSSVFLIPDHSFSLLKPPQGRYFPLRDGEYQHFLRNQKGLSHLMTLRRFLTPTRTADLLLREFFESRISSEAPISKVLLHCFLLNTVRKLPSVGRISDWLETSLYPTNIQTKLLKESGVHSVVIPGIGSQGFEVEGLLAREAGALHIPVAAAITNYDNLTSRGFRGFMPELLSVWSMEMAREAREYHHVPSSRIQITGPIQFDRYFVPLRMTREEFLRTKGLDPSRKTILFAGSRNIFHDYHFYRLLKDQKLPECNVVFRPYPVAPEIAATSAWRTMRELISTLPSVYLSDPLIESSDTLSSETVQGASSDLDGDTDTLHYLLRYSDVLINFFSTISLEALVCDLPVIHVAYDEYTSGLRAGQLLKFRVKHDLNKKKLKHESARVAKSPKELLELIDAYLEDRTMDREKRREYALSECEFLDGKASERFISALEALVRRP
jgi:hypothetical protein